MSVPTEPGTLQLDPFTFEILRHRLWAINEEAATTMKLVSGSTVATAANDLNTAIMDPQGNVVALARYSLAKATTLSCVVRDIVEQYEENPGIEPGDGFLCNDVYVGVQHQNDVAFVMPFYYDGKRLGWVGAEVHQVDVGGPVPGNVQVGAKDIYGEAPLIPPLKIVEGGVLRHDIERGYIRRSRLPENLALDLRAKWAACNVAVERLTQLSDERGPGTVVAVMEDTLTYVERKFRARLAELPDGTWRHVTYLDFERDVYPIRIAMTKAGDTLRFDFTGSAVQAPAIVNCTRNALVAVLLGYVCMSLCWDIPWSPSAIGRAVEIVSEPGTIVHCEWPAGVCKSTTSVSWSVGKAVGLLIGKMLACSDTLRVKAMASWQGAMVAEDLYGTQRLGHRFGATITDAMAGAGGARTFRDGIDTGGYLGSMGMSIPNVETYESEYPILYLYRSQVEDGGGAGAFRGGVSLAKAYTVHEVTEIPEFVMHCVGVQMPLSPGLYGGYPAGTNQLVVKRATDVAELFARSAPPSSLGDLDGKLEVHDGIARTRLGAGDVYSCVAMGGGGYGDPLDRDPDLVARDVGFGLVSKESAAELYGVVLAGSAVDNGATEARRAELRGRRLTEADEAPPAPAGAGPVKTLLCLGPRLRLIEREGERFTACSCGRVLAPASENYKHRVGEIRRPLSAAGPQCDPYGLGGAFELREYVCPACAALLEVDMLECGEPTTWDIQLA